MLRVHQSTNGSTRRIGKQNHHISMWHGGAEPPYGLRRNDRSLNALWDSFIERPRLLGALGRELEASYDSEGITISWRPVEAGMPEILKLSAGSLGSSPDATIDTAALIDFVISHDPRLDELTFSFYGDGPRRARSRDRHGSLDMVAMAFKLCDFKFRRGICSQLSFEVYSLSVHVLLGCGDDTVQSSASRDAYVYNVLDNGTGAAPLDFRLPPRDLEVPIRK